MEAIIGIGAAAIIAGVGFGLKVIGTKVFLQKYGAVIAQTYAVIDPIAGQLISGYEGSTVDEAIELAVLRVSDGDISQSDLLDITKFVVKQFSPALAASKVLDPSSETGRASMELVGHINALKDGASKDEIVNILRTATSLVR